MILDTISLLLNATTLTLVVSNFIFQRNREPIEFSISKGFICPVCKNDIDISSLIHDPEWQRKILSDETMVTVCVQCKRDSNIGLILRGETLKSKVVKFILSKNWKSYYISLLFGSILMNLFSALYPNLGLNLIGSILCLSANLGFTYRNYKTTRKKSYGKVYE